MIAVGARVRLRGLLAKPELNGKEGKCREKKLDTGRWTVVLEDGRDFAFKEANLELVQQGGPPAAHVNSVVEGFDSMLAHLETTRQSICDAMVYCLDHAVEHAAPLARRLTLALGKPGLSNQAVLARLYVIGDVLHNCGCSTTGAESMQFLLSFREHLPEAFEKLGRVWLRKIEQQEERSRMEGALRQVFEAWRDGGVFPALFTKGLESLLFAQVHEVTAREAAAEPDEKLRRKLTKWFAGLNQAELPHACQERGLSGKALPTMVCRARLCHFERYWHLQAGTQVQLTGLMAAPHLNGMMATCDHWDPFSGRWKVRFSNGDIKAVKPENLLAEDGDVSEGGDATARVAPASLPVPGTGRDSPSKTTPGADPLDGEPLTAAELRALAALEAEAAAQEAIADSGTTLGGRPKGAASQGGRSRGVWTQVSDSSAGCLGSPADFARGGGEGPGPWTPTVGGGSPVLGGSKGDPGADLRRQFV